ncbi:MAG TPA: N-acetylmuramoyl-L-alanine amidase, partial [Anaerolineae bacterium]
MQTKASFPRAALAALAGFLLLALTLAAAGTLSVAGAGQNPPDAPPQQATSSGTVCFVNANIVSCVDRIGIQTTGTLTDAVRSLMQAMIDGPTVAERAQGVRSALPDGAALADVSASPERVVVRLDLPKSFLTTFDAGHAEDVNEQIATTLTPFNFARIDVEARDPAQPDIFRPLSSFLPPITIPKKPGEITPDSLHPSSLILPPSSSPEYGQPQSQGGLGGKTVFVSAGHGWFWSTTQGQYRTQRPHYPNPPYPSGEGIVEDFNNAEMVDQLLLQYLWNSGADAWTVRERDMNPSMLIVDNASAEFSVQGAWASGASGGYNSTYVSTTTLTASATATATWSFTPTADAEYSVFVWFPNTANRTAAARYTVDHAGGTAALTITQQHDGIDWRYIGTYPFRGGVGYRVRLTNQSVAAGFNVLADAIRIGGGVGDQIVGDALTPSGKPRWEEQARLYAKWVGLPDVDTLNDVIVRPIFSEWEYESGEDAIYISYHTNGYNGYNTTARGTETYIHSFEPTPNSDLLQDAIHASLIGAIHAGWEPAWPDRGQKSMDLGELRLLETMPGVLIENGYHDSPTDVEAEKDPRFNLLSARAIYQGIVRYWNSQDPNVPLVFLPEPPTHLRVRNSGPNRVTLAWQPGPTDGAGPLGDAATSYRVYTSTDGFGWGAAISTTNTVYTITALTPGQLIYVRVTGANAGGESFPTPVLAARVASNTIAPVLIVHGFDRIDRSGLIRQLDGVEGYSRRLFLDRINRYDYIVQHATGITYAFDSAVHAAVTDGDVGLGNYIAVDWIGGEEQSPNVALNATDQALLTSFLDSGGALLISGAEIGFDLVGNGVGPAFYNNTLHAAYAADDAGTYSVSGAGGSTFAGLSFSFDDGTHGTYNADYPDSFSPAGGGSIMSALMYNGGLGGTAALQY